jgi:hypothetical protein
MTTTTTNKMALLRRPGEQPTPVPESVASSDEQLAQLFPGILNNALVHRERTRDGVLQVSIVQKALVEIEGRTLVVDDLEDVRSDEKAREWLVLIENWASNADIKREVVSDEKLGQALKLTITKKAGPKGSVEAVRASLCAASKAVNPALSVCWELQLLDSQGRLTSTVLLQHRAEIERAIEAGQQDIERVGRTHLLLMQMQPVPSIRTPAGF